MARPKKTETKVEKQTSVRDKIRQEKQTEAKRRNDLVKKITTISKDLTIEIVNCTSGTLIYQCPVTKITTTINGFGGTDMISYESFKYMVNQHKGFLDNYFIIPIGVYGSDEITMEEIFDVLKVDSLYEEDMLYDDYLDYILKELSFEDFKVILKEFNVGFRERIAERSIELSKQGDFNDSRKRNVIKKLFPTAEEAFEISDELIDSQDLDDDI